MMFEYWKKRSLGASRAMIFPPKKCSTLLRNYQGAIISYYITHISTKLQDKFRKVEK